MAVCGNRRNFFAKPIAFRGAKTSIVGIHREYRVMLKDLALVVDVGTDEGGLYAVSLAKLIDAHLTIVPVDVESLLAAYAYQDLHYDMILAKREERREAIAERVDRFQLEGIAQGLPVDIVPLEDSADDGIKALGDRLRLYDLIVVEQNNTRRSRGARVRLQRAFSGLAGQF